ncbi:lytic transglycosylase domain-containing protein [Nocardioides sp.]|uniref:lytic transglycosylase domain-containing protein n=1 Tax=Nocardioides sp. TaxID=35761 RepID=UPI003784F28A
MITVRPLRLTLTATVTLASLVVVSQPWRTPAPIQKVAPATVDTIVTTSDPVVPVLPKVQGSAARGTLRQAATAADVADIPIAALSAYQRATTIAGRVDRDCGLTWTLLAAIGGVESDHGRVGGSVLGADGVSRPLIRGVELNGHGRVAKVADTDAGQVDGDKRWDRAVGPMQFLPSTWATLGVDADGDGVRSADDLDDAALGAAVFLCAAPGTLDTPTGLRAALHRYNPSTSYAARVIALEHEYSSGRYAEPDALPETPLTVRAVGPLPTATSSPHSSGGSHSPDPAAGHQQGQHPGQHQQPAHQPTHPPAHPEPSAPPVHEGSGHNSGPSHEPTHPTVPPDPTDPTDPPTPTTQELTGTLQECGTEELPAWCVDDTVVDLGDEDYLAATALADFDADGTTETNAEEVAGLLGTEVTVLATVPEADDEVAQVLEINDLAYVEDGDDAGR